MLYNYDPNFKGVFGRREKEKRKNKTWKSMHVFGLM
jgi:hypothetical protein